MDIHEGRTSVWVGPVGSTGQTGTQADLLGAGGRVLEPQWAVGYVGEPGSHGHTAGL